MAHATESSSPAIASPRRRFFAAMVTAVAGAGLLGRGRLVEASPQSGNPYVGEVMLWAGNFAPLGWAFCDGSLLPIAQYDALFALIGTTYGGDGVTTFALPDLRGRIPIHAGQGTGLSPRILGEIGGSETVTLSALALPTHSHTAAAMGTAGTSADPTDALPARDAAGGLAYGAATQVAMAPGHIGVSGSNGAHENRMPHLALNYCIALFGVFPSPN